MVGRVVEPVLVGQQHAEHRTQLDELMPVPARAGQPAHLQAEDQPDVVEADLGQQSLEARPPLGRWPLLPWSSSMTSHAVRRPAQLDGAIGEVVLRSVDSWCSATCWGVDWRT